MLLLLLLVAVGPEGGGHRRLALELVGHELRVWILGGLDRCGEGGSVW